MVNNFKEIYKNNNNYYSPLLGIYDSSFHIYTEYIHDRAKIYFNILDSFNLEYSIIAGQSVGMIRNKKNCPWIINYDIILLNNNPIKLFETEILPILKKNNFMVNSAGEGDPKHDGAGYQVTCKIYNNIKYFKCNIFYSKFDENNILRNNNKWGLYNIKNIPKNIILPFTRQKFHNDLYLPFFNNIEKEVEICYGDVFNKCIIKVHNSNIVITYDNWTKAYTEFETIKNNAIAYTKKTIYNNKIYTPVNKLNILKYDNNFKNELDILKYININNIGTIYIFNQSFLIYYANTIRYYYPNIKMEYFAYENINNNLANTDIIPYINYINVLNVNTNSLFNFYNYKDIYYINKPIINIIKLITFGTFDLFYKYDQNLFNKYSEYSEYIICGISNDLCLYKNNTIINSFEKKKNIILNNINVKIVFPEESLQLKNTYINKYDANILMINDNIKDNINNINCCILYNNNNNNNIFQLEYRINYYLNNLNKHIVQIKNEFKTFYYDQYYLLNNNNIKDYNNNTKLDNCYLFDMMKYISMNNNIKNFNILCHFGDIIPNNMYPCISKVRKIYNNNDNNNNDNNTVILKLNTIRHWDMLSEIKNIDIPFNNKSNTIVWRGASTGETRNCKRKVLVNKFQHHNNKNIDIKFSDLCQDYTNLKNKYIVNHISKKDQLKNKFIISIEGNDVASNLKWLMISNSCVLMPIPTICSWFMEDHLVPYIHYVPLKDDFEDLESQYNWCLNNLDKCQEIVKNANMYTSQFTNQENENKIISKVLETYIDMIKFV